MGRNSPKNERKRIRRLNVFKQRDRRDKREKRAILRAIRYYEIAHGVSEYNSIITPFGLDFLNGP